MLLPLLLESPVKRINGVSEVISLGSKFYSLARVKIPFTTIYITLLRRIQPSS
jgi:hypothetical protein